LEVQNEAGRAMDWHVGVAIKQAEQADAAKAGRRYARVIEHIYARLEEQLSVAELAALACQSQFHFTRMFKKSTGLAPHRFITYARIDKARDLLAETSLSCHDVAAAVGFCTHSHFTTVFTRWVGISPERFRRLIKAKAGQQSPISIQQQAELSGGRAPVPDAGAIQRPGVWHIGLTPAGGQAQRPRAPRLDDPSR